MAHSNAICSSSTASSAASSAASSSACSPDSDSSPKARPLTNQGATLDGGWGWVVTFAASFLLFLALGIIRAGGIFYVEFVRVLGATPGRAAWPVTICAVLHFSIGPVSGSLCQLIGERAVVFIGVFLGTLGLFLGSFAPSVEFVILTHGFLVGMSSGIIITAALSITNKYFSRKRSLATGIAFSGGTLGGVILPPLIENLLEVYSFRETLVYIGGIYLQGFVVASLLRPAAWYQKRTNVQNGHIGITAMRNEVKATAENDATDLKNEKLTKCCDLKCDPAKISTLLVTNSFPNDSIKTINEKPIEQTAPNDHLLIINPITQSENHKRPYNTKETRTFDLHRGDRCYKAKFTCRRIDLSVVSDPVFLLISVSGSAFMMSFITNMMIIAAYGLDNGLDKRDAALLMSVLSFSDLLARIGYGWILDRKFYNQKIGFFISTFMMGLFMIIMPQAKTWTTIVIMCTLAGAAVGASIITIPVLMAKMLGVERFSMCYGMFGIFVAPVVLSAAPLVGFIKETSGVYNCVYYTIGTVTLTGSILWLLAPLAEKWRDNHHLQ